MATTGAEKQSYTLEELSQEFKNEEGQKYNVELIGKALQEAGKQQATATVELTRSEVDELKAEINKPEVSVDARKEMIDRFLAKEFKVMNEYNRAKAEVQASASEERANLATETGTAGAVVAAGGAVAGAMNGFAFWDKIGEIWSDKEMDGKEKFKKGFGLIMGFFGYAGKIFEKHGFWGGLSVLFSGSGDDAQAEGDPDNGGDDDDGGEGNVDRFSKDEKYEMAVKIFLKVSGNKDKNIGDTFTKPGFRNEDDTYIRLKEAYNHTDGEDGISERVTVIATDKETSDKNVYNAIGILIAQENRITSVLGSEDWKTKPLEKVFLDLYPHFSILEGMNGIEFDDLLDGKVKFGELNFKDSSGDLQQKLDFLRSDENSKLNGVSLSLLTRLYGRETEIGSTEFLSTDIDINRLTEKNEERIFLKDFKRFGLEMNDSLKGVFGSMFPGDGEDLVNSIDLSTGETLEFYIITGGESDLSKLTDYERDIVLFKLFCLMGKWGKFQENNDWTNLRGKTFDAEILKGLEGSENSLPEGFNDIIINLIGYTLENLWEQISRVAGEAWNAISQTERTKILIGAFVGLVAIGTLWFVFRKIKMVITLIGMGFAGGVLADSEVGKKLAEVDEVLTPDLTTSISEGMADSLWESNVIFVEGNHILVINDSDGVEKRTNLGSNENSAKLELLRICKEDWKGMIGRVKEGIEGRRKS